MFVKIEYWSPLLQDWDVGHAGLELDDPVKYLGKLSRRGTIARSVDLDTGVIVHGPGADLL